MLYLAQVKNQEVLGEASLELLACQNADDSWAILSEQKVLTLPKILGEVSNNFVGNILNEGVLVLADVGENSEILNLRSATNWVVELVDKYLKNGITLEFLQLEAEKAEEWRQSLTLQSQELSRRLIEVEARREQIQNLEAKFQKTAVEPAE
ncbi:hypothetical protein [Microcoleus sp. EPA2]|uniref:hypothetical protein n=1 Tax=Microcoleus sp. EPA2 TaxID=2841654 RepID=UPI00312B3B3D